MRHKETLTTGELVKPIRHELSIEALLKHAIVTAHHIHKHDPDLVRESAKHHGVAVSEGSFIDAIEHRAYNFRLPHGEGRKQEFETIMNAEHIVVGCMDYRQSHHISEQHKGKNTVFFFTAGGCVQPPKDRLSADVTLVAIAATATGADINLYYHTGVCGGANHFTDGTMRHVHDEQELAGEIEHMDPYAIQFAAALVEYGIVEDHIRLHRVDINEQNEVIGIVAVPFSPKTEK